MSSWIEQNSNRGPSEIQAGVCTTSTCDGNRVLPEGCDHTLSQICTPVGDDVEWNCGSCGVALDIDV